MRHKNKVLALVTAGMLIMGSAPAFAAEDTAADITQNTEITSESVNTDSTDTKSTDTETTDTESQDGFTIAGFQKGMEEGDDLSSSFEDMDLSDLMGSGLTSEALSETLSFSTEDILESMHSALLGDDTSLSEVLQNYTPFEIDMDSYYSIEDLQLQSENDFGTINLQYVTLSNDLAQTYSDLDMSGFSRTAVDAFSSNYGDLASRISLDTYSIPDGFSVSNILSAGSAQINALYSTALSSDMFQTVRNNISFGSIFAEAQAGVSVYSLKSTSELRSMILSGANTLDNNAEIRYNKLSTQFNADLIAEQKEEDLAATVYEHTGSTPDQITSNQDYIDAVTEEMENNPDYADEIINEYATYVLGRSVNDMTAEEFFNGSKGYQIAALSDVSLDGVDSYTYPTSYEDLAAFELAIKQVNQDGFDPDAYGLDDPVNSVMNVIGDDSKLNVQRRASYISQLVEKQKSDTAELNAQTAIQEKASK